MTDSPADLGDARDARTHGLLPGERIIDGRIMYSSDWLNDSPAGVRFLGLVDEGMQEGRADESAGQSGWGTRAGALPGEAKADDTPGRLAARPSCVSSAYVETRQELIGTWDQLGDLMTRNEPVSQRARWEAVARYCRSMAGRADQMARFHESTEGT